MKRKTALTRGKISGFVVGILIYLLSISLACVCAAAISADSDDPMGASGLYSLLGIVLAGALGGFVVCKMHGEGGVRHSTVCAAITSILLLLCGIIGAGGIPKASAFINYISFLGTALVFAFIGRKKEKKHKRRRFRRG